MLESGKAGQAAQQPVVGEARAGPGKAKKKAKDAKKKPKDIQKCAENSFPHFNKTKATCDRLCPEYFISKNTVKRI